MPTPIELTTLVHKLQTAIMEYIALSEGKEQKASHAFDMDYITNSAISARRKDDIRQMQKLWQAAIKMNRTAFSLAEIIHVYFTDLLETGFMGFSLLLGRSRLRDKIFAVIHTDYPILTFSEAERAILKPLLKTEAEIKDQEKIVQLEDVIKTSQHQTKALAAALKQSQQQNITLVKKTKKLQEDNKILKQNATANAIALNKEQTVNKVLRNTIQQRDECIRILTLPNDPEPTINKPIPPKPPGGFIQEKAKHFVHFKMH